MTSIWSGKFLTIISKSCLLSIIFILFYFGTQVTDILEFLTIAYISYQRNIALEGVKHARWTLLKTIATGVRTIAIEEKGKTQLH